MQGAVLSDPAPRSGEVWRVVEAQHRVSTMKLVDTLEEQTLLEEALESTKPPVPEECKDLNFLLFTPFRYAAANDSRFRRAGQTLGVFYAAEDIETSIAEVAFWRLLFFIESPQTPWPANPLELTAFSARYETARCLDLTRDPYADRIEIWTAPVDYAPCHQLADEARDMGCEVIRSLSARDPHRRATISILSCTAFCDTKPVQERTWRMRLGSAGIFALCDNPHASLEFDRDAFGSDPRVRAFAWSRPG